MTGRAEEAVTFTLPAFDSWFMAIDPEALER